MKNILNFWSTESMWGEFLLGALMVLTAAALGYFAREFALDLQTNFFAMDWRAF